MNRSVKRTLMRSNGDEVAVVRDMDEGLPPEKVPSSKKEKSTATVAATKVKGDGSPIHNKGGQYAAYYSADKDKKGKKAWEIRGHKPGEKKRFGKYVMTVRTRQEATKAMEKLMIERRDTLKEAHIATGGVSYEQAASEVAEDVFALKKEYEKDKAKLEAQLETTRRGLLKAQADLGDNAAENLAHFRKGVQEGVAGAVSQEPDHQSALKLIAEEMQKGMERWAIDTISFERDSSGAVEVSYQSSNTFKIGGE